MKRGDRVLYIHNIPWENRKHLLGSIGTIYNIDTSGIYDDNDGLICREYCGCHWTAKNHETFDWYVPKIYIRLLKPSDLS